MPTDFLTSLNTNGSGLNIRELSEVLTEAEIAPRRDVITERIDQAELQASGYALLRGQAEQVNEALNLITNLSPYALFSSDPAVNTTITDPKAVTANDTQIEVTNLAKAQILNFGGFSDPNAALGGGELTIEFGSWTDDGSGPSFTANTTASQTLTISAEATLNELAAAFSSIDGISAQVIEVGDGTFTLGLITDTGADNAINITDTGGGGPLAGFDISADPSTAQAQAAQDAELIVNGVAITRASNEINNLLPGVSVSLSDVTTGPATLRSTPNTEGALEVMRGFVDILNATNRLVTTLTDRGFSTGAEAGALAGDRIADQFLNSLDLTLSRGYGSADGSSSTFLSDLGILTERDGTFSLNEAQFNAAITSDPGQLNGLLRDSLTAEGAEISGTPLDPPETGTFTFLRNPTTGDATLNGLSVAGEAQLDGSWVYTVTSGSLRGTALTVAGDSTGAEIEYAASLVSALQVQTDSLLSSDGPLATRNDSINSALDEDAAALDALDIRAQEIEERFLARFTQMEQVITQLNSTGDFIDGLLDQLRPPE
ncbi:MAG: flagellar filament capping protein FliD [Pseudomonadota bacterium]